MPEIRPTATPQPGAPHPGHVHDGRPEEIRASVGPLPVVRPRQGGRRFPLERVLMVVELAAILALWEFAQGTLKLVNPIFLPPPSRVVGAIGRMVASGELARALSFSLTNFVIGFFLAAAVGVVIGFVLGGWRPAAKLLSPLVWALYSMPLIAIRPMTTIWFGFGVVPIIFLIFFASLLPVALNTMAGVRTVDPSLRRAAAVFGASRVETYAKVVFPATVPFVLTGLRLAVITGWIILLASELVGAPRGLGQILAVATSRFRVDEAFAVIVIVVVLSVATVRVVGLFERRVASWRTVRR